MKLGFIGTGIITTSVVTGFCESGMENLQIVVSPRNKERAQMLHEKYPEIVSVAADNQEVVDRSDWVFAALLPKAAEDILKPLHIGPEKKFINLVATLSLKRIEEMFGPREILADVVPLTFAANRFGPVVIYPDIPEVVDLMSHVGKPVPVDTPKQIAAELHVHVSTIYREIKRARWEHLDGDTWIMEDRYNPDGAEKRYRENLAAKGAPLKIGNDHELADYLERKVIEEDRSPAAALADITIEGRTFKTSICVSTFYGYIEKGVFLNLTNKDLPEKPKRKRPYHKVKTTKRAPRGESIEKRPEVINQRITFGHWEMDTVYSGKDGSCALLVLTERLSRKEIIEKMRDRTAISTVRALNRIERRFGALFPRVFQTITVDNGGEFSDVKSLERSILRKGRRTKMYYCHPYTSCERGSNECANKMIRRKFPKGTDFNKVSRAEVKKAEEWMNNYPREILGWKTAEIVFAECLEELAREA